MRLSYLLILTIIVSALIAPVFTNAATSIVGDLGCNPARAPNSPVDPNDSDKRPPCGFPAFVQFLNRIVEWMGLYLVMPLTGLFIAWGAFVIMTSGGNSGRLDKGKRAIRMAIIGLVIYLLAFFIIKAIFIGLNVLPGYGPTIIRQ